MKHDKKLPYALDSKGNKCFIERFSEKDKQETYFCPYCKKEVVAKMGDEKVWHFSHLEGDCSHSKLSKKKEDISKTAKLDVYRSKTVDIDEFKPTIDPDFFTCALCKKSSHKEYGMKMNNGIYICKDCYKKSDVTTLSEFL